MGFLSALLNPSETRDSLSNPSPFLVSYFGGSETFAGKYVNPDAAVQATAVFACIRLLAGTVASLPFIVYQEKRSGTKKIVTDHQVYHVIGSTPNTDQTSFEYREMIQGHLELRGNAYSQIVRDGSGQLQELVPLNPDKMRIRRNITTGVLEYWYKLNSSEEVLMDRSKILHNKLFSSDGIMGLSPIQVCKEAIGLALGVEEFGSRLFGNGTNLGGILNHLGNLSENAAERLKEQWKRKKAGLRNAHDILLLEEGMTYQKLGMTNEESQFLLTRKFQLQEICRIFGVPPHMIADLERSTNNNIEHQGIEFVTHTIRPRIVRQEQSIVRSLFTEKERRLGYGCEYRVDALLRGDTASRYTSYSVGRQWGWLSANDVRDRENMERLPPEIGDVYLEPMNMMQPDGGESAADDGTPATDNNPPENPDDPGDEPNGSGKKKKRSVITFVKHQLNRENSPNSGYQLAFSRIFDDKIAQIRRKESAAIAKAARRLSQKGTVEEFNKFVSDFYGSEHKDFISDVIVPAVMAFREGIGIHDQRELTGNTLAFIEEFQHLMMTISRESISEIVELGQYERLFEIDKFFKELDQDSGTATVRNLCRQLGVKYEERASVQQQ